jgi:hypothetical protein
MMNSLRVLATTVAISIATAAQAADHTACMNMVEAAMTQVESFNWKSSLHLNGADVSEAQLVAAGIKSDYATFKQAFDSHGKAVTMFDWAPCMGDTDAEANLAMSETDRATEQLMKDRLAAPGYRFPKTGTPLDRTAAAFADSREIVLLPHYDVDVQCRRFGTPVAINACRAKEQEAYDTLKAVWPELRWGREWILNHNPQKLYQAIVGVTFDMLRQQHELEAVTHTQPFRY